MLLLELPRIIPGTYCTVHVRSVGSDAQGMELSLSLPAHYSRPPRSDFGLRVSPTEAKRTRKLSLHSAQVLLRRAS